MPRTYLKLAAVVLASGIAAAACGTVKMGAAAIVGNQRISGAALNGEAANLSAAYQQYQDKIQIPYPSTQIPQQALAWMVRFRVRDQLASRYGISVTSAQSQQALNDISAQIRQSASGVTLSEAAVSSGLPPDMLSDLGRYQAIQNSLLNRFDGGKVPSAATAQQALISKFNQSECRAAKGLSIQINPQYGALDYNTFSVVSAPSGLSKPATPTPAATSRPQLTAPC